MTKTDFERELLTALRTPAPKPRELQPVGTGQLHGEQQFCYERGWREGIAAYRRQLRTRAYEAARVEAQNDMD